MIEAIRNPTTNEVVLLDAQPTLDLLGDLLGVIDSINECHGCLDNSHYEVQLREKMASAEDLIAQYKTKGDQQ